MSRARAWQHGPPRSHEPSAALQQLDSRLPRNEIRQPPNYHESIARNLSRGATVSPTRQGPGPRRNTYGHLSALDDMSTTMEINPSSLTNRADSTAPSNGTPVSARPPPIITNGLAGGSGGKTPAKPTQSLPRVDIEPIYTQLKSTIGDNWAAYKDAVSRFVLGFLNQDELCRATQHFIAVDPAREHLHNQLLCAILANVVRDVPEAGVASWVSANDKPTSVTKPVTGNAAEQRLKHEVMQLPPRFRHRIKSVKDEPRNPVVHAMHQSHLSRRGASSFPQPGVAASTPLSATHPPTPAAGLNKEVEIRRRFNAPLISESSDIPSPAALAERVLPICYEEGLANGASGAPLIGELLGTALEFFVKESLASVLGPTRANGSLSDPAAGVAASGSTASGGVAPSSSSTQGEALPDGAGATAVGIATAAFKRRVAREAAAARRGELKRNEAGLLPVEVATQKAQGHGRGLPGDVLISWDLDNPWLKTMMPWHGARLLANDEANDSSGEDAESEDVHIGRVGALHLPNPDSPGIVNGDTKMTGQDEPPDDLMAIDEADWGWKGAKDAERKELGNLLDECLTVGG